MDTITRDELQAKRERDDDFVLVNVLSAEQFAEEHIPGSVNIPLDQLEDEAPERLATDDDIVVYCASPSCQASPKAAQRLEAMGFENVADYEGGLSDWKDGGLPTESS